MYSNDVVAEIKNQYQLGERSFQNRQLRNLDLRGIDLSQADFSGADFTGTNLRDANLSHCNLRNAYFNEADLTGVNLAEACLEGASLIKTYLNKANLSHTNLQRALLTNAYATKANLSHANLNGAFLNGAKLSGAILTNVEYDNATHFDTSFDLQKIQPKVPENSSVDASVPPDVSPTEPVLKVADLLVTLNHLSHLSHHYLGGTMTLRYWQSTRPDFLWLNQFQIDRTSAQITYEGDREEELTALQLQWSREWVKGFARVCSQIIQDYPNLIDRSQIIFTLTPHRPKAASPAPSYGHFPMTAVGQSA